MSETVIISILTGAIVGIIVGLIQTIRRLRKENESLIWDDNYGKEMARLKAEAKCRAAAVKTCKNLNIDKELFLYLYDIHVKEFTIERYL